jgi:hypothetical protein
MVREDARGRFQSQTGVRLGFRSGGLVGFCGTSSPDRDRPTRGRARADLLTFGGCLARPLRCVSLPRRRLFAQL